jgi:hypothetical protein
MHLDFKMPYTYKRDISLRASIIHEKMLPHNEIYVSPKIYCSTKCMVRSLLMRYALRVYSSIELRKNKLLHTFTLQRAFSMPYSKVVPTMATW